MRRFIAALLARRTADGRKYAGAYLVLILMWHLVVFAGVLSTINAWLGTQAGDGSYALALPPGGGESDDRIVYDFQGAFVLFFVLAEGLLGWTYFRVETRRYRPPRSEFIRHWWRACRPGSLVIPALAFTVGYFSQRQDLAVRGLLLGTMFLVIAPGTLARIELRRPCSRWRPKCPECGYSLRGLTAWRCPECGTDFPEQSHTYRRWGFRRLNWERVRRGGLLSAYVRSLAAVVFRPLTAARGVGIPDRWGRCARWAVVHVLLAAVAAPLFADVQRCVGMASVLVWPAATFEAFLAGVGEPSLGRVVVWEAQKGLAWLALLMLAVGIGCGISYFGPGRHPAAKAGGVKWSLYATAVFPLVLAVWYGAHFAVATSVAGKPITASLLAIPVWLMIVPYGLWWAIGIAGSPHNRERSAIAPISYAAAYFGVWVLMTCVILPPGPLEALL